MKATVCVTAGCRTFEWGMWIAGVGSQYSRIPEHHAKALPVSFDAPN